MYTSGMLGAHAIFHEKRPRSTFGDPRVVNGPPWSPPHALTVRGLLVHSVYE